MSNQSDVVDEGDDGEDLRQNSDDLTDIRSSPPLLDVKPDRSNANRKRPHESMDAKAENQFASSATMTGDPASSMVPPKQPNQSPSDKFDAMPPPKLPPTSSALPFSTAPTSAQIPHKPDSNKPEPDQPAPAKPLAEEKAPQAEREATPETDDPSGSPGEPQDPIEAFDWRDLEERYHDKMIALTKQEQAAMQEFGDLCQVWPLLRDCSQSAHLAQFFAVWSDTGSRREIERSFKR